MGDAPGQWREYQNTGKIKKEQGILAPGVLCEEGEVDEGMGVRHQDGPGGRGATGDHVFMGP